MSTRIRIPCRAHLDRKPGQLLKFADGGLKFVKPDGSVVNAYHNADGSVVKVPKLSKKERVRARRRARTEGAE